MATSEEAIKLKNVRLSFPRLFQARAFQEGQDPRYEGTFLLDPSNKAHAKMIKQIEAEADALAKEKWKKPPKGLQFCFGDADEEGKEYDGYEGMFYISTSNKQRPTVIDRDRTQLVESDGKPYAGSFVNTNITLWTQDNKWGKRINANLRIVQFVGDGDAFGVKPVDAEEEMDILDDDDLDSDTGGDEDDWNV